VSRSFSLSGQLCSSPYGWWGRWPNIGPDAIGEGTPLPGGHGLPTIPFAVVRRHTDGLLLEKHLVQFTIIRSRPIMFLRICAALIVSSWCADTNSNPRSAPATEAIRRAWRRPWDSITIAPAARSRQDGGRSARRGARAQCSWEGEDATRDGEYVHSAGFVEIWRDAARRPELERLFREYLKTQPEGVTWRDVRKWLESAVRHERPGTRMHRR
jgi:hypothetical protein